MQLDFKATAQLNDDEAEALSALSAAVYPPQPSVDKVASRIQWADPQWSILIRDEDHQLVSHVGALTRLGLCDGEQILIGGIGGVMTHPAQRRKGYAAAGVRRAIDFLRQELEVDISLLVCGTDLLCFYQRFGFSAFSGDTFMEQNGVTTAYTSSKVMVMPGKKALPSCKVLDLCGLPW